FGYMDLARDLQLIFIFQHRVSRAPEYKVVELPTNLGPTGNLNKFPAFPRIEQATGGLNVLEPHIPQVRPDPADRFPDDTPYQSNRLGGQPDRIKGNVSLATGDEG